MIRELHKNFRRATLHIDTAMMEMQLSTNICTLIFCITFIFRVQVGQRYNFVTFCNTLHHIVAAVLATTDQSNHTHFCNRFGEPVNLIYKARTPEQSPYTTGARMLIADVFETLG